MFEDPVFVTSSIMALVSGGMLLTVRTRLRARRKTDAYWAARLTGFMWGFPIYAAIAVGALLF